MDQPVRPSTGYCQRTGTLFIYIYALTISSMMRYHLQDFIKSEHLQIINVFAYFTISKKCPYFFEVDNYFFLFKY